MTPSNRTLWLRAPGERRGWIESAAGIGLGAVSLWLGPVAIVAFLAVCLGLAVANWKVRRNG